MGSDKVCSENPFGKGKDPEFRIAKDAKRFTVVYEGGKWALRRVGSNVTLRKFDRRSDALEFMAKAGGSRGAAALLIGPQLPGDDWVFGTSGK